MDIVILAIAAVVVIGASNVLTALIVIRGVKNEPLLQPGEHKVVQADVDESLDDTNPEANGWLPHDQHYV